MEAAKIKEGYTIFAATPYDDAAVDAAKKFINDNGFTSDDVRLGNIGNTVVIVAKREVELK